MKPPEGLTQEVIDRVRLTVPELADSMQAELDKWLAENKSNVDKWLDKFITQDVAMLKMKEKVKKCAVVDDPVLIVGETGTGKELIANALHGEREGKFVPINCAGIPETLIESELFGYAPGAFTGGLSKGRIGLMEVAKNGTLFLDEIGELDLNVQAKLLRALQEKVIRRVGGEELIKINCRVVSATHRDLEGMIDRWAFREDLYYRISTLRLSISSLKVRPDDIKLMLMHLGLTGYPSEEICHTIYKGNKDRFSLVKGNVRSLQQIVRRYQVLNELP